MVECRTSGECLVGMPSSRDRRSVNVPFRSVPHCSAEPLSAQCSAPGARRLSPRCHVGASHIRSRELDFESLHNDRSSGTHRPC